MTRAAAPPAAEASMLTNALKGLDDATMWIAEHASDGDGHSDAITGISRAFCLLRTLEAVYGPSVVDEIFAGAMLAAEGAGADGR